jgi:RNA polymerase sigma factor (sigma-70 family)
MARLAPPVEDEERIVADNWRLVPWYLHRFEHRTLRRRPDWEEDLIAAGLRGLVEAVRRYDPAKGKLSTYAYWWIKRRVLEEIRAKIAQTAHETSLDQPTRTGGFTLGDAVATEAEEGFAALDQESVIEGAVRFVTARQGKRAGKILRLYAAGMTMHAIASEVDVTQSRVQQIIKSWADFPRLRTMLRESLAV